MKDERRLPREGELRRMPIMGNRNASFGSGSGDRGVVIVVDGD